MSIQPTSVTGYSNNNTSVGNDNRVSNNPSPAISEQSFSKVQGEVLSGMKSLDAKRYVKVGDTHGKSGFSALGQILSNIGHNIKVLFSGSTAAIDTSIKNLNTAARDLERFGNHDKITLAKEGQAQLTELYRNVKNRLSGGKNIGNGTGSLRVDPAELLFSSAKNVDKLLHKNKSSGYYENFVRSLESKLETLEEKEWLKSAFKAGKGIETLVRESFGRDQKFTEMLKSAFRECGQYFPHQDLRLLDGFLGSFSQDTTSRTEVVMRRLATALENVAVKADIKLN